MKTYSALIKRSNEGKISEVILIKDGFSFFAFLFSAFWFLYHKMTKEFFALMIIAVIMSCFEGLHGNLFQICFAFIIALNANYWFCEFLRKKGYEFIGIFFGTNKEEARLRVVEKLKDEVFDDSILNPQI